MERGRRREGRREREREREIQKSAEGSLESLAEYWSEPFVRKLPESRETTTQKSRGHNSWSSHEAKNSLCSHSQNGKPPTHKHQREHSEGDYLSSGLVLDESIFWSPLTKFKSKP